MNEIIAYLMFAATLIFFGYIGFKSSLGNSISSDDYLSARGTQSSTQVALTLFASGMGVWILFGPSEVAYYGGFWDVLGYALSASTPFLLLAYVGPKIREELPDGVTLADYAKSRTGRPMQLYIGIISILYMFTFLFAEFTAIGKAMEALSGMEPLIPMVAVGLVTASYTAYGGLPASLGTDKVQAWVIITLILSLLLFIFGGDISSLWVDAKAYGPSDDWSIGSMSYMGSFESGLALVLAITAAEMFSQGNWQRVWSSEDEKAAKNGALLAALLVFPLVFVMGIMGTVAAGQGGVPDPSAAFFYLIQDTNEIFIATFIILATALVCSSIDTLQNAIVASVSRDISDGNLDVNQAKIITIAMIPIAIYLATGPTIAGFTFNAWSVFGIFLFADIIAAATVAPILLTLWSKISSKGAFIGAISGILSIIVYGFIDSPSGYEGASQYFRYVIYPTIESVPASQGGLTNLWPFASALIGSSVVTVLSSYAFPDE